MAIEARPEDFSLLAGLLEAYAQCQDYEGALATALVLSRDLRVPRCMSGLDGAPSSWAITKPVKRPMNKPATLNPQHPSLEWSAFSR